MSSPLLLAALLLVSTMATAGTLKGTIVFPTDARSADARPRAFWRVENGRLPILPAPVETRAAAIVVLEPENEEKPPLVEPKPQRITLEIKGLKIEPKVVVAPVGTLFEFKNADRVTHTLFLQDGEPYMAREPLEAGKTREIKLTVAGDYQVRDAEYPHAGVTLLVVATPHHTHADERGEFRFEAPNGRYSVRAWVRGAWSTPQPVEVGRTSEVLLRFPPPADPLASRRKEGVPVEASGSAPKQTEPASQGRRE